MDSSIFNRCVLGDKKCGAIVLSLCSVWHNKKTADFPLSFFVTCLLDCKCHVTFIRFNAEVESVKCVCTPGLVGVEPYGVKGLDLGCERGVKLEDSALGERDFGVIDKVWLTVSEHRKVDELFFLELDAFGEGDDAVTECAGTCVGDNRTLVSVCIGKLDGETSLFLVIHLVFGGVFCTVGLTYAVK